MNFSLRASILALAGGSLAIASLACNSDSTPAACVELQACCTNPNFADDPSSCSETAMSVDESTCAMDLEQYQSDGECPSEGGVTDSGVADATEGG